MKIRGYFLPPHIKVKDYTTLTFDRVEIEVPVLTPDLIWVITEHLLAFHDRVLMKRPVHSIVKAFGSAIRQWQKPSEPRQLALAALPAITGFSPEMIVRILEKPWAEYRSDKINVFLKNNIYNYKILDEFTMRPSMQSRAFGPRLTTHILAGNIPGAGIPDLIMASVIKSANLVKTSGGEPLLPVLFAESLAEIDSELAQGLAVVWWRGGDQAIENAAFSRSDCVIASGSDETIKGIQQRVKSRFIGYGHRLSFGLIGKEVLKNARTIAKRAALDVAMYDQQGCLSPHLFYVEAGGTVTPKEFAGLLADELEALSIKLPRGKISTEAASTLRQLKDLSEIREAAGNEVAVYSRKDLDWLAIYEADPFFVPSPLYRAIRVKPLKDFSLLPSLLQSWTPYLQAAGVAVGKDRRKKVAESLGRL
ncbi:MAG TPA: acyl-CoA reductase, partial [Nitrospiria bacterium]|nr:acyl-CoA reductase [Nitrospiria bacterium]